MRVKVLMSAYACGPGRGSEPGIGWNSAREMSSAHDVWLITSSENRAAMEAELAARPNPSLHVEFVDWPRWMGWVKRSRFGYECQHYAWQVAAYLRARRLHRAIGFDVVHHVTFCRYWMPSFLALLPVPFLWGPVGGGESAPRAFWNRLGIRGVLLEMVREAARWLGERDPFLLLTARRSALALATTEESRARMARLGARQLAVVSQVALSEEELEVLARGIAQNDAPLRFISIGRLLHWKGFALGLEAFAQLDAPDAEYWIVGTGPARASLVRLADQLGVSDRVTFHDELPRAKVLTLLQQAHVLVHPSLHDSGGMVCLEAMAAGKPVICLDLGGPAMQVTSQTGFKVAADAPELAVAGMVTAMRRLASRELREQMGAAARLRAARDYNWRVKGEDFARMYAVARGEATWARTV